MDKKSPKISASDERYTKLLSISPFPIAIHVKGIIVYANKAALNLIQGKTQKDIVGKHVLKFIHPDYHDFVKNRMVKLMAGKKAHEDIVQEKFLTLKKEVREVELASIRLEYNGEQAIQSTIRDITQQKAHERKLVQSNEEISADNSELKRVQELLRDSEEKYRMMIEQSLLSTQILSPNGMTLQVNKAWERLWGLTFEQLKGYNMLKDKQLEEQGIMPYIKKGFSGEATMIPAIKYETEKTIKNVSVGTHKWVQAFIYPVKDDKGKIREVVLIHEDITATKQFERQKDDFLGIASHELKTPVTSIKMYGQVLNKMFLNKGDVQASELMNKMDVQINKLTSLITDLLDVTKIQSGRMQFNNDHFDFNELVFETVEELQHTSTDHKIIKELSKVPRVFGDRDRIGQVITNFITNAIKYSPNAKKVIIRSYFKNGSVCCEVKDFGIGISKQDQPHIFEQFYRSNAPRKNTFPGLGLGLFISREIMRRHNGDIWVTSAPKKGSTFCFKIPIKK